MGSKTEIGLREALAGGELGRGREVVAVHVGLIGQPDPGGAFGTLRDLHLRLTNGSHVSWGRNRRVGAARQDERRVRRLVILAQSLDELGQ